MSKSINLELSNSQAIHVWSIMVNYIENTSLDLKASRVFKKDGTRNLKKKYVPDYIQEQLDNLALAELIYKHIENSADFSELEQEATNDPK